MTPIQLDPNHSSNSFSDTTLVAAQRNTKFALDAQVAEVNAARVADYDTQWKSYMEQRNAMLDYRQLLMMILALYLWLVGFYHV